MVGRETVAPRRDRNLVFGKRNARAKQYLTNVFTGKFYIYTCINKYIVCYKKLCTVVSNLEVCECVKVRVRMTVEEGAAGGKRIFLWTRL